ncbi:inositol monophosphatase family protein [soil metagenome]
MSSTGKILSSDELRKLCEQVQIISMRIGKFIREERTKITVSDIENKGSADFVSYVDKTSEERFVEALGKLFLDAGFIAEENSSYIKKEIYNWVIDPLDGTTNYLQGIPCFATSVALLENGKPVLGVVFEINLNECFYAWKSGGAWLNGKRIFVAAKKALQSSLVATGFPYQPQDWHDQYIALFSDVQSSTIGMRRIGSAATDIAYVACGRFDAYYEKGIHAWDVAAGALLITEAGGIVSDFSNGEDYIFGREFVCGNKMIHPELLNKIKHHLK